MSEILAPAGNKESALAAINNGANAIYLGLSSSFSARQGADNFDEEAFRAVLTHAHFCDVKVYVALNTVIKSTDDELSSFFKDLLFVWNEGADAVILQDPLLGKLVHELYPQIVLHLSTQAGVCNLDGAEFAKECGFSRVILARETPLEEIKNIAAFIETEVFVQGALCACFSGQCYFSSFAGGNSGNRGRCKQPCRKKYAYDRNGNTEKSYALSLSDLCVGDDIKKLVEFGVVSFKIEGRMRRAEYVAAAVAYYREILDDGAERMQRLSDLRRTYNRGNYTKGLAFGQDKRFLSTDVQGHLGEKVGVVKVVNGNYAVESRFQPRVGDAFKILREGKEVGGATYVKSLRNAFIIHSKVRLKNGDGVFITTDTAVNARLLSAMKRGTLRLSLRFEEGKRAVAIWNGFCVESDAPLQSAQNRPLDAKEIKNCFYKTDGLPVDVLFDEIEVKGSVFIPKSELNAFRRKVYEQIARFVVKRNRDFLTPKSLPRVNIGGANDKTAIIADEFAFVTTDIGIYKPKNYAEPLPESFVNGKFEKYLYYPAFATCKEIEKIAEWACDERVDGVYAENYGGVAFAKKHGLKLFAGTGFNLTNEYSIDVLSRLSFLSYYAISKELRESELKNLLGDKAFLLSSGNIKIMDFCYCPFVKTCAKCDCKEVYSLVDEGGRVFPVRRYLSANGDCRFEVYNCADLIGTGVKGVGKLLDLTLVADKNAAVQAKDSEERQKNLYKAYTSGHFKRGVF